MTEVSWECWTQIMDELEKPAADTPERRATFARIAELEKRLEEQGYDLGFLSFQRLGFRGMLRNALRRKKRC